MPQLLFTLLAMFSGASIAAAVFATWCLYRLRQLSEGRRRRWYSYMIFVKVGVIGTFSILLAIIIPRAEVEPSLPAWFYIVSLSVAAYGLIGLSAVVSDELASVESANDEAEPHP